MSKFVKNIKAIKNKYIYFLFFSFLLGFFSFSFASGEDIPIEDLVQKATERKNLSNSELIFQLIERKEETIPALIEKLENSDKEDLYNTLSLIQGQLRWPDISSSILSIIEDKDYSTRNRIKAALIASAMQEEALPAVRDLFIEVHYGSRYLQKIDLFVNNILSSLTEKEFPRINIAGIFLSENLRGISKTEMTRALGIIGKENDIEKIKPILNDKNPELRLTAAEALGMLGSDLGEDVAIEKSKNKSFGLRKRAAAALAYIPTQKAQERLKEMKENDSNSIIREDASGYFIYSILNQLSKEDATSKLEKIFFSDSNYSLSEKRYAFFYLAYYFSEEGSHILEKLANNNGFMHKEAKEILFKIEYGIKGMSE